MVKGSRVKGSRVKEEPDKPPREKAKGTATGRMVRIPPAAACCCLVSLLPASEFSLAFSLAQDLESEFEGSSSFGAFMGLCFLCRAEKVEVGATNPRLGSRHSLLFVRWYGSCFTRLWRVLDPCTTKAAVAAASLCLSCVAVPACPTSLRQPVSRHRDSLFQVTHRASLADDTVPAWVVTLCQPVSRYCADQGKGYITEEDVARVADAHEFAWDVTFLKEMVHLFSGVCLHLSPPRDLWIQHTSFFLIYVYSTVHLFSGVCLHLSPPRDLWIQFSTPTYISFFLIYVYSTPSFLR